MACKRLLQLPGLLRTPSCSRAGLQAYMNCEAVKGVTRDIKADDANKASYAAHLHLGMLLWSAYYGNIL